MEAERKCKQDSMHQDWNNNIKLNEKNESWSKVREHKL